MVLAGALAVELAVALEVLAVELAVLLTTSLTVALTVALRVALRVVALDSRSSLGGGSTITSFLIFFVETNRPPMLRGLLSAKSYVTCTKMK